MSFFIKVTPTYWSVLSRKILCVPWQDLLLVIEDSSHEMATTLAVLNFFHNWLVPGEYIIIEDGIITDMGDAAMYGGGPRAAVEHFLGRYASEYEVDSRYCDWFGENVTWNVNGFLRRRKAGR